MNASHDPWNHDVAHAADEARASTRTASILIRTKNEERSLGATLQAVYAQQVQPHEVIVIDSGSTDATLAVAAAYPVRLLHIAPREFSYPLALNRAAAVATGEILVCLSAHCPPAGLDWLGNLLRHFDDPSVAGVWGPNLRPGRPVPQPGPPIVAMRGSYTIATRTWGLSNSNSALRRSLWEQGPFDESMSATEDKAWGLWAMEQGYSIVHDPAAPVWHGDHSLLGAYRRGRAVQLGFTKIFPAFQASVRVQAGAAARAAWRALRFHAANRDWGALWWDIRRTPILISSIYGSLRRRR